MHRIRQTKSTIGTANNLDFEHLHINRRVTLTALYTAVF